MRHYILVEVSHDTPTTAANMIGAVRKAIHQTASELDGNVADTVVREDRWFLPSFLTAQRIEPVPYGEAVDLFHKAMGSEWSRRRKARDVKAAAAARVKDHMLTGKIWTDPAIASDLITLTEPPF